jgi:hypothetical protein
LRALPAQTCPSPVAAPHRPVVMPACMMPEAARQQGILYEFIFTLMISII